MPGRMKPCCIARPLTQFGSQLHREGGGEDKGLAGTWPGLGRGRQPSKYSLQLLVVALLNHPVGFVENKKLQAVPVARVNG